jgi:hypothetical protein
LVAAVIALAARDVMEDYDAVTGSKTGHAGSYGRDYS